MPRQSLRLGGASGDSEGLSFEGFAPTIMIGGPETATGDAVIKVSAPGATSEPRLSKDDLVSLKVAGAGEIGGRGEPQALKTLRQKPAVTLL